MPRDKRLLDQAHAIGQAVAAAGLGLIYGGGQGGMMGAIAKAVLGEGGYVHGITPRFLLDNEGVLKGLSELTITDTMHDRKQRMYDLAAAFLVLPGGYGTMEEMLEVITWCQLQVHSKPVYIFNEGGFWSPMLAMFEAAHAGGFIHASHMKLPRELATVAEVVAALEELAAAAVADKPLREVSRI